VYTALICKYVEVGGGRHTFYLGESAVEANKWATIAQIPAIISTSLTKISIAVMILRISNSKKLKWAMFPLIFVVASVWLIGIILLSAACRPYKASWDSTAGLCWPEVPIMAYSNLLTGKCFSPNLYAYSPVTPLSG